MKTKLRQHWQSLPPHQRQRLVIASLLLVAIAYGLLIYLGGTARRILQVRVGVLHEQARQLNGQAVELERLRALPPLLVVPAGDLLSQLQAQAGGLAPALTKAEALSDSKVNVTFAAVAFADWLRWLDRLKAQRIRVSTCQISALPLPVPGMVSVTATLIRDDPS